MRIFLIGFMGSGKSTLGFPLAKRMGLHFVDLDTLITNGEGRTISEIFADQGETYFRELEHRYLEEYIASEDNFVMSTGGGTPCFNDNMSLMNGAGRTVYLKLEPEVLKNRLMRSKTERPLLKGKSEQELLEYIRSALASREDSYNRASVIVANPSRDVSKLVSMLRF